MIDKIANPDKSIKSIIDARISEFRSFATRPQEDWFSELCFCLLTANSRAKTALNIQKEIGFNGFSRMSQSDLAQAIRKNKHRFHNTKSERIVSARKHLDIKSKIQSIVSEKGEKTAREWLVSNIKGLGYKEASHFLRNTGHFDSAIIDRHIIRFMNSRGLIKSMPKVITPRVYLEMEDSFNALARKYSMPAGIFDLFVWHHQTGEVLK